MAESAAEVRDAFRRVEAILAEGKVSYAFMGAAAVIAWGRMRATTDVDCVVSVSGDAWAALDALLRSRGLIAGKHIGPVEPSERAPDLAVYWTDPRDGVRIDLFIAKLDFEREAVARARVGYLGDGTAIRVIAPESSIVYKLIASRSKDLLDVESIFEARRQAGAPLDWASLERWCADWEISDRLAPWRARYGP